ncbi:hypothetical protein D0X99_16975 [Algoriphagus lacus]|uniref:Thioredoxin domain-containing protein n=1 Tax=Algoriphagus lacus TaxID=2056311 RepID=A0A418PNC6_9BACT|nr:hypothetical protein [Algoriphagus lacus]RIW13104.1 hypothetical protein D0X99_16975 [Algoriphagus lacus]
MKKFLFTCFLAPVCLIGSTSFLSQVAQSPGADFPHRSVSNREGETLPDNLPGRLYLELATSVAADSLDLRFWDHLVSDRMTVNPGIPISVPAIEGNMFEGSRSYYVFEVPLPQVDSYGFFSIGRGKNTLGKHWFYFPSDRVRLRADLLSGSLIFGGPDADFYRLQHEVDLAFKEVQFNTDPVLFSSSDSFLQDSLTAKLWEQSQTKPEDLYVKMRLINSSEAAWSEFEQFVELPWLGHPAMEVLDRYVGKISQERLELVETGIRGRLLFQGINKAELAWPLIQNDPSKLAKVREWVDGYFLKEITYSYPQLAQGVYQWSLMGSMALRKPIQQVFAALPNPLREEVIAFYILDNFNRMEDRLPDIIAQNLPLVESPWIIERLNHLLETGQKEFVPTGMLKEDGNVLDPNLIKGKTLLIHFWINGCKFCLYDHQTVMKELSAKFQNDPNVLILTVNADPDAQTWKMGLESGDYTSPEELNTWVPKGSGILETYGIHSFPQKMIIGPDGKVRLQTIDRMDTEELYRRLMEVSKSSPSTISPLNP